MHCLISSGIWSKPGVEGSTCTLHTACCHALLNSGSFGVLALHSENSTSQWSLGLDRNPSASHKIDFTDLVNELVSNKENTEESHNVSGESDCTDGSEGYERPELFLTDDSDDQPNNSNIEGNDPNIDELIDCLKAGSGCPSD